MNALRIFGLVLMVVLVITGLDYYQQDKKHEDTLSAGGYVDTIKARFANQQEVRDAKAAERDRKKRWKAGAKSFLPATGEGWARYELAANDNAAVKAVLAGYGPTPLISSIASPAELARLSSGGEDAMLRKLGETGMVYAKGEEIAWIDISLKPESVRNTLAGIALSRQQSFLAQVSFKEGFAVIDGVAFMEVNQDTLDPTGDFPYRKIIGRIGIDEEVVIRMHTNADDSTIHELLEAVDYAALNALLTFPSPVVGQGNSIAFNQQPAVADKMNRLYSEMVAVQEKTTSDKLSNLDVTAVIVNMVTSAGLNSEGLMDITGGEVFENQDVLQIGYGRALQLLLDSAQRQAALQEAEDVEDTSQAESSGFFANLKDKLPAFGGLSAIGVGSKDAGGGKSAKPVRVYKGGLGASCAKIGSGKRCSASGQ
ncbi:hypothetical protein [Ruegeria sp. SCP11]|uniref:hypothetical protein n=1 Tax=Ruegeria sp. SCP11 TaxID=3141378 RepID=UPI0033386C1E